MTSTPYRTPGVPPGRLLHQSIRFFVTREEWEAIQTAMHRDGQCNAGEWAYQIILKALRERGA